MAVHAFITSCLDYYYLLFCGISKSQITRLQLVQNAAARFLQNSRKCDHISPIFRVLHWLPIQFRINLLVYKSLHNQAPSYLSELLRFYIPSRSLRSGDQNLLLVPQSRLKRRGDQAFSVVGPLLWNNTVESFRFLGTTISQDLKWDDHIESMVKKAQQRLYFLCQLRKCNLPQELLIQFYSATIESVLCMSITVWFSSATKSGLGRLRRLVRTAERIIGTTLPTLQELYSSRVSKRAGKKSLWTPQNLAHSLFELLPSGRRYRALITRTTRHRNSFFPQAIHLMNT